MDIPDRLTFSVSEAAELLGMGRGQLHDMINAGSIRADEWFPTSGKRPTRRIKRGCIERLGEVDPAAAAVKS